MPILPLAPGRFSTKTGGPGFWLGEGAYGMISRTGLVGQDVCVAVVCATTGCVAKAKAGSSVRIRPGTSRRARCIAFLPAIGRVAHTSSFAAATIEHGACRPDARLIEQGRPWRMTTWLSIWRFGPYLPQWPAFSPLAAW